MITKHNIEVKYMHSFPSPNPISIVLYNSSPNHSHHDEMITASGFCASDRYTLRQPAQPYFINDLYLTWFSVSCLCTVFLSTHGNYNGYFFKLYHTPSQWPSFKKILYSIWNSFLIIVSTILQKQLILSFALLNLGIVKPFNQTDAVSWDFTSEDQLEQFVGIIFLLPPKSKDW